MSFDLFVLELPTDVISFVEYFITTPRPRPSFQSLSVRPSLSNSIWGSLSRYIYSSNRLENRRKLYLRWVNNSHNIRTLLEKAINGNLHVSSVTNEDLKVSLALHSFDINHKLFLLTSTLIRDITDNYENRESFNLTIENFDNVLIKDNLLDDELLLICSSSASDLNTYEELKQKVNTECIDKVNNEGFLLNNSESQLWIDGAKFYGLSCCKAQFGFLKFEEQCIIEQCHIFMRKIIDTYSQTFIACSSLVVLWLVETQVKCSCIKQMFGKDYVLLSGEDLNSIVVWLLKLKEKFEDNGIACIREIYDECVGKQESELNKPPVVSMPQQVPDIKMIDDSVDEIISS